MSAALPDAPPGGVFRRVRRTSPAELIDRGGQLFGAWLERWGLRGVPGPAEARAFRWLADRQAAAFAGSAEEWLTAFRSETARSYCPSLRDRHATVSALLAHAPGAAEDARRRADRILAGRFDLLGYEGLEFGHPIDWHLDPVHGVRAPGAHWSTIRYLDPAVAGDHKIIWELNRQQFLVTLGQAYWITGDERYAERALELVDAWMDANPPMMGINWASSLEIAFRALSWLWLLALTRHAPSLTPRRFVRMMDGLALSARHIERFLSTWFSPNTHLTGEALALFAIGTLCPELRQAARWRLRGAGILRREVARHVLSDGVYFERSTYYHRYTVDIYLHYLALSQSNGLAVDGAVRAAVERLLEHLLYVTRPDGTIPLIGDDDGGRLLPLDQQPPHAVRGTLSVGAVMFRRTDFAWMSQGSAVETVWLLGEGGAASLNALGRKAPAATSRAFPEGGVYAMRDGWDARASVMIADAGPHGVLNCGHAHADALSFDLTIGGVPVFVDPGTFTYTGDATARDHFRSTEAHNALSVDGRSSSEPGGPFSWRTIAQCEGTWGATDDADALVASHDGFSRLSPSVACGRTVLHVKGRYWLVADRADSPGPHDVAVALQCAYGIGVTTAAAGVHVFRGPDRVATIRSFPETLAPVVEEGAVSPRYGVRLPAPRLRYVMAGCSRFRLATFITPAHVELDIRAEGPSDVGAFAIRGRGFEDLVVVGDGASLAVRTVQTNARLLWLRSADGAGKRLLAVGASLLIIDGADLSPQLDGAGVVAWARTGTAWTRTPVGR